MSLVRDEVLRRRKTGVLVRRGTARVVAKERSPFLVGPHFLGLLEELKEVSSGPGIGRLPWEPHRALALHAQPAVLIGRREREAPDAGTLFALDVHFKEHIGGLTGISVAQRIEPVPNGNRSVDPSARALG
ncbi:hypothetical protein WME97_23225 [Sorangium sp. So ce367]|uniref:hypothetical protein n=1 Tax=Sorangium sp. So ce367 TaxID=3133305 RepID=UPI003F61B64A